MMAGTFGKFSNLTKSINYLTKLLAKTSISTSYNVQFTIQNNNPLIIQNQRLLMHTTSIKFNLPKEDKQLTEVNTNSYTSQESAGLMEFFDDPKNWGVEKIKTGRSWKKDELRLKSNEDLHKLWFVLLKERNMLKTMEHNCNEEAHLFPNPERIDKVEDSMENIELVVRERNNAYYMLETGQHGERPTRMASNILGLRYWYRMRQYAVPKFMNTKFHKTYVFHYGGYGVAKFRRKYFEKLWLEKRKQLNQDRSKVALYFRKFPNVDVEAIKQEFPHFTDAEINKIKMFKRSRGHYIPK